MAMRGVETRIQEIRHRIFTEVARMAYHTEWPTDRRIEALPFDIMLTAYRLLIEQDELRAQ